MAVNPEVDLKGLDQIPKPDLSDFNANVSSAEKGVTQAQGNLDTAISDVPIAPQPEQFNAPAPKRDIGGLMSMSPWLIALATFGGARTKLSANNIMAATTGMINGLVAGDEQRYQDEYDKWQAQYKSFADLQKQKWDIYKEMVKVYKDRIDGKERALQVAEQAVRDARNERGKAMTAYQQEVRSAIALRDEARKWAALDEQIRAHKAAEAQKAKNESDKRGKTSAKAKDRAAALTDANAEIDQLISMLKASKGGLGITGLGGKLRRGIETAANVSGVSDSTTAHDFETRLSNLQLKVAPILASSNRTAKDQREKIESVVRGLKAGDTRQSTISALEDLKKQLNGLPPEEERKVKRTGTLNGRKVVEYEDGQVEYAD